MPSWLSEEGQLRRTKVVQSSPGVILLLFSKDFEQIVHPEGTTKVSDIFENIRVSD